MVYWTNYASPKGIQIQFFKIKYNGKSHIAGPIWRDSSFSPLNYIISRIFSDPHIPFIL